MVILKILFCMAATILILAWIGKDVPRPVPPKPIDCFSLPPTQGIDCLQDIQRQRKWGEIVRELSR